MTKSTTKSPDVSAAACRARLEQKQQKRPVEDRLADAGEKMKKAGNEVMLIAIAIAFLVFISLPLLLAAFK